jgi:hypothetical protein
MSYSRLGLEVVGEVEDLVSQAVYSRLHDFHLRWSGSGQSSRGTTRAMPQAHGESLLAKAADTLISRGCSDRELFYGRSTSTNAGVSPAQPIRHS